ncbi:MAG: flagellar type III secretion system protein FlhB [Erythrobacter sp.]
MSEETTGEKRFEPTEKRKQDAAKKGDVLRSKEAATAAALATGAGVLVAVGPMLGEGLASVARAGFRFDASDLDHFAPGSAFLIAARAVLPPIFAIGIAVIVLTVTSQLLLGEGRFVPSNVMPKASRISPLKGFKRIFGTQGLIELGKSILKLALLGSVAAIWIGTNMTGVLGLGRSGLTAQLAYAGDAVLMLAAMLIGGLLVIALIDYPLQLFQRSKRLKMSHQDMREESKQSEGSPEMKSARRQRQRDLARGGVAKAMEEAQFIVTNPLHFAVALKYDPALAPAPIVLAKGRGETALAMRELAGENACPVLEYPSLARALYFTTRANQMVREELYIAIAALVAFVLSVKRGERPRRPQIDVPAALRFDTDGKLAKGA